MNVSELTVLELISYLLFATLLPLLFLLSFVRINDETFFVNRLGHALFGWWLNPLIRGKRRK
jgi:hypothetical protein